MAANNPFEQGGAAYARHRPTYPDGLAATLAGFCRERRHAVDVGCGAGQLSTPLGDAFERVTAFDPSRSQLDSAAPHPRVEYRLGAAESIDLPDGSADLVVAAQAAHWFDLPAFYAEARRVLRPGGALALVTYGVPEMDGEVGARFADFYWKDIHRFWPAERRHVEDGYLSLAFPFAETRLPDLRIVRDWRFEDLRGYVGTWSAAKAAAAAGAADVVEDGLADLRRLWGDPAIERRIVWPVLGRVAVMPPAA